MNIYVGNMSYDTTENELREAFSAFGTVTSVSIIMDRETGRPRGFAFVEMANDEEGKAAIEALNLQKIGGRSVTVNEARPREDRGGGGGGRRGGGGGGGGGGRGGRGGRW
ncbi:MAG: RNA recognition motif domain-containing protein [Thermoguttaceae bacterium]